MKTVEQIELCRNLLANLEVTHHRAGNLSPEQKAWLMASRAALSWVLDYPQGGKNLDQIMQGIHALQQVVNPFVGSKTLDEMRRAE